MASATRADPKTREEDYFQALHYYVTAHPRVKKLVFIENSGWPLGRLQSVLEENPHQKQVEFISLDCNDFPRHLGKSYGEMQLLDKGFEVSRLAREAEYLGKLTGRLRLANLTQLLQIDQPFDLLCDLRDHGIYEILRLPYAGRYADVRLLAFKRSYYDNNIRGRYKDMDESQGRYLEGFIYQLAKHPFSGLHVIPRFLYEPAFEGLAGHWNKNYSSPRQLLKRRIRGMARRLAPWLYI